MGKSLLAVALPSRAMTARRDRHPGADFLLGHLRATPQHCSLKCFLSSPTPDTLHSAITPTLHPRPIACGVSPPTHLPFGVPWARILMATHFSL